MIKFSHVTKAYPKGAALTDVSFHVPKGEFCFLTGHSGAGKTTALKLIFLAEQPTSQGSLSDCSAPMAACSSMRLLLVAGSPPLTSRACAP